MKKNGLFFKAINYRFKNEIIYELCYSKDGREFVVTPVCKRRKSMRDIFKRKPSFPNIEYNLIESGNFLLANIYTSDNEWDAKLYKIIRPFNFRDNCFISINKGETWQQFGSEYKRGYEFAIYHDQASLWDPDFYGDAFKYIENHGWERIDRNWWSEGSREISWHKFDWLYHNEFQEYLEFKKRRLSIRRQ